MRNTTIQQVIALVLMLLPWKSLAMDLRIREVGLLSVNSAITPATYDYLRHSFEKLPPSCLIVLKLNTPGGLVSTTKDIITLIGRSKRPFAVWITPEGASASSAGAIIASAAHYIFMSPGTNMGAATPVGLGEDIQESDGRKKALNDLTALVRSLSSSRDRPPGAFEKMITRAESYTAKEALKLGIIDGVISDKEEMVTIVSQKNINIDGVRTSIKIENLKFTDYEPTAGQKLLEVLANPSTAYILFLIGIALIYFEFQSPGGYISGSIGLCFLLISGISFQVLPLDWGSMALIIAGILLLVLEVFIVSYGILSISGLIAFTMGSLFLFHGEGGFISVQYHVIISSLAGVVASIGLILWYLYNESKKLKKNEDFFLPSGAIGNVLTKLGHEDYQVKVRGEIWRARSSEDLQVNDMVEVVSVDPEHLIMNIKKVYNKE